MEPSYMAVRCLEQAARQVGGNGAHQVNVVYSVDTSANKRDHTQVNAHNT
jgi:hypothetical protein